MTRYEPAINLDALLITCGSKGLDKHSNDRGGLISTEGKPTATTLVRLGIVSAAES